jgi:hypothetical protein
MGITIVTINMFQELVMIITGWWLLLTPLKNMKIKWDYCSQYTESHKSHVPNHQPEYLTEIYWDLTVCDETWPFSSIICTWPRDAMGCHGYALHGSSSCATMRPWDRHHVSWFVAPKLYLWGHLNLISRPASPCICCPWLCRQMETHRADDLHHPQSEVTLMISACLSFHDLAGVKLINNTSPTTVKIRGPKKGTWPDTLSAIHAAEPTVPGTGAGDNRPNLAAPWWKHQHGWHQKTAIQWIQQRAKICAKRGPFRDSREDLTARRQCVQQTTVEHQQHLWNIFEAQRIAQ